MNIELNVNGKPATRELRHFARFRADYALGALRDQVGLIGVLVDPIDSGDDVRCLVTIQRSAQADLVVEGSHANPYVAIHKTLDEAGRELARSLMQQHSGMIHRHCELIDDRFETTGPAEQAA